MTDRLESASILPHRPPFLFVDEDDFDAIYERAAAWKAKLPELVTLDGPMMENQHDAVHLHNFYVAYLLPLTIEIQWFDWKIDLEAFTGQVPV